MTAPAPLSALLADRLIAALRHGQAVDEAAAGLGVDLRAV